MGTNRKNLEKLTEENFDIWLHSLGFLYPMSSVHLQRFDKLYEDYDFKLKNKKIDTKAIIDQSFCSKPIISDKTLNLNLQTEIESLKMIARKGDKSIPQRIIDKMKQNHKKKDDQN